VYTPWVTALVKPRRIRELYPVNVLPSRSLSRAPGGHAVRSATAADLDRLVAIEEAAFPADRISRRSFRALVDRETAETLVIEARPGAGEAAVVLGYAMVLFRRGTALARLYSIAVHPDAAGRGYGGVLLEAAEEAAFDHDRLLLRLEVREDNSRAIALYEKRGYRPIGRAPDYYADGTAALRFEKTLRGDTPLASGTPYFEQTTDFTCGPACLMMALARRNPTLDAGPVLEIRLWRESTTVFMMSGMGGCEPFGLAVAAHERGLSPRILVSSGDLLFMDSVRSEEKRKVMALAQADFRARAKTYRIPVERRAFTLKEIRAVIRAGGMAIVLVSGYYMFGKRVPHWVLAHGDDGRHILIHDPWVDAEEGETIADAANLPVPHAVFDRMARFGRPGLRAAILLGGEH